MHTETPLADRLMRKAQVYATYRFCGISNMRHSTLAPGGGYQAELRVSSALTTALQSASWLASRVLFQCRWARYIFVFNN